MEKFKPEGQYIFSVSQIGTPFYFTTQTMTLSEENAKKTFAIIKDRFSWDHGFVVLIKKLEIIQIIVD